MILLFVRQKAFIFGRNHSFNFGQNITDFWKYAIFLQHAIYNNYLMARYVF